MNTFEPFIVYSCYQEDASDALNRKHLEDAQKLTAKHVTGSYKGSQEPSFVSLASDLEEVRKLAFGPWRQESILHVDANRLAYLEYANGKVELVGRWKVVSEDEALALGNYTHDRERGIFYSVV